MARLDSKHNYSPNTALHPLIVQVRPFHVCVKCEDDKAVMVDAARCKYVADLIALMKEALELVAPARLITLCTSSRSQNNSVLLGPISPRLTMSSLVSQSRFKPNDESHPPIVQVQPFHVCIKYEDDKAVMADAAR